MPYKWSEPTNALAFEPVELVAPDGTLTGVSLRTMVNAWGQYQERTRLKYQEMILAALNGGKGELG